MSDSLVQILESHGAQGPCQDQHGEKQCHGEGKLQPEADGGKKDALNSKPKDEHAKQRLQAQPNPAAVSLHQEGNAEAKEDGEAHVVIRPIHGGDEDEFIWQRICCE